MKNFIRHSLRLLLPALPVCFFTGSFAFADDLHLIDKEQLALQRELSMLTAIMWGLVVSLILFAVTIRYIARRTTHPCRWCMEFIPNSAAVCPRCGKAAVQK